MQALSPQMFIPQEVAETTTVTVTATNPPELPTRTIGRPWTTAQPYVYTMTQQYYTQVQEVYPLQPTPRPYVHCSKHAGAITGAFFGGLGLGLIICIIVTLVLCMKIRRLKKILRRAESNLYAIPAPAGSDKKVATRGVESPAHLVETEPLLTDDGVLVDVEAACQVHVQCGGRCGI
ncbi:hypothetical protein B0H11DRAFT_2184645 [Mycena galericulata]|nr:hypothetical protein B0H11DRAFT_2184645 [Mycena galericulata]